MFVFASSRSIFAESQTAWNKLNYKHFQTTTKSLNCFQNSPWQHRWCSWSPQQTRPSPKPPEKGKVVILSTFTFSCCQKNIVSPVVCIGTSSSYWTPQPAWSNWPKDFEHSPSSCLSCFVIYSLSQDNDIRKGYASVFIQVPFCCLCNWLSALKMQLSCDLIAGRRQKWHR